MLLVLDFAILGVAEGRTEDAYGVFPVALNFQVDGVMLFDGSEIPNIFKPVNGNNSKCMATKES